MGQTLDGRYRLDAPLGAGSMGEVYRGMQVSLKRPVAVKVLPARMVGQPDLVQRFEREAQLLSRLKHPGIVSVIDFGWSQGRPYLVMELVEGKSLDQVLGEDGKLPPERVARVLLELCEALEHAHAMGVLHRDLKPSNILLEDDRVRVVDFGVARALEQGSANITGEGMVLGTPKYCSPEQAMGLALDGRSDLYALGVVAWRMLVGRVPFDGEGPAAIFSRHVLEIPPPLAQVANLTGEWRALGALVDRLLAKSPGDRYPSAVEAARAVQAIVGTPSADPPRTTMPASPIALGKAAWGDEVREPPEAGARPEAAPSEAALDARAAQVDLGSPLDGWPGAMDGRSALDARPAAEADSAFDARPTPEVPLGRPTPDVSRARPDSALGRAAQDASLARPGPDASPARPSPPDTRMPDTRMPDTRMPDTHLPETRMPDARALARPATPAPGLTRDTAPIRAPRRRTEDDDGNASAPKPRAAHEPIAVRVPQPPLPQPPAADDGIHDTLLDDIARTRLDSLNPPLDEDGFAPTARTVQPAKAPPPAAPRSWIDRHPGAGAAIVVGVIAAAAWAAASFSAPDDDARGRISLPPAAQEARAQIARGDVAGAMQQLEAAVERAPRDPALRVALGHAYLRGARADDAIPHYLWASRQAPQVFDEEHAADLATLAGASKTPAQRLELVRAQERIGEPAPLLEAAREALDTPKCDDKRAAIKLLRERENADVLPLLDPIAKGKACGAAEARAALGVLQVK